MALYLYAAHQMENNKLYKLTGGAGPHGPTNVQAVVHVGLATPIGFSPGL